MLPHTVNFWLSLTGAILMGGCFGIALPSLLFMVYRHLRWAQAHPWRSIGLGMGFLLSVYGMAWGLDAYSQWFGLTRHLEVLLFACGVMVASLTGAGFIYYKRLDRLVSFNRLNQEQRLLEMVQQVSRCGYFVSRPSKEDPSLWRVFSANKAACDALGYVYRTSFDNELIGTAGHDLIAPEQLDVARSHASQAERTEYVIQLLGKRGGRQWVEMSGATLLDYFDGPVRVSCFTVVTAQVEQMRRLRDELQMTKLVREMGDHVDRITRSA